MTAPHHPARRAAVSARAWRRNRVIDRRAARALADGAADAARPAPPGVIAPVGLRLRVPSPLAGPQQVGVLPAASLQGRSDRWIV
jgi:hypothetical protein